MSQVYNFSVWQGSRFITYLNIKDSSDAYLNTSGYSARGQVRYSFGSSGIMYNLSPTIDPSYISGRLTIDIPSTGTSSLPVGRHCYDVEIFNSGDSTIKVLRGKISVEPEVTR